MGALPTLLTTNAMTESVHATPWKEADRPRLVNMPSAAAAEQRMRRHIKAMQKISRNLAVEGATG